MPYKLTKTKHLPCTFSKEGDITSFQGNYRWLSNFYPHEVMLDGITYPSVENAYQAAKTLITSERIPFQKCSASSAKKLGYKVTVRENWDDVKLSVMRDLIMQKYKPNSSLGIKLLKTGNVDIVEGNTHRDTYWGKYRGVGKNNLGILIMQQRDILASK